jgi:hypothetical protein
MAFMTARIYNIEAPVGDNQPNLRGDVQLVQALLTEKLAAQAAARKVSLEALLDRLQRFAPNCVKLLR